MKISHRTKEIHQVRAGRAAHWWMVTWHTHVLVFHLEDKVCKKKKLKAANFAIYNKSMLSILALFKSVYKYTQHPRTWNQIFFRCHFHRTPATVSAICFSSRYGKARKINYTADTSTLTACWDPKTTGGREIQWSLQTSGKSGKWLTSWSDLSNCMKIQQAQLAQYKWIPVEMIPKLEESIHTCRMKDCTH